MNTQDLKLKVAELKDTIVYLRKELELIKNKNKMENKETVEEAAEIDLTNLCYYDKRNPDCSLDDEDIEDHKKSLLKKNKTCSCDNCFYGRTELTEQLIRQQERSYTEEEVYKLLCSMPNFFNMTIPQQIKTREKWFEQFKKK